MQAASGVAASIGGIGAALMTFVVAVLICCIIFIMLRARET
jgi:nitrate/nitrite transporter NarK